MHRSFASNFVRPNLPLRKPLSSPFAPVGPRPRPPTIPQAPTMPDATPVQPLLGAVEDGPTNAPVSMDQPVMLGSMPPALVVYFCNFCGQKGGVGLPLQGTAPLQDNGNVRCKRCKKTPYCSVVCQTEDWKAHRHMCKSIDPEPAKAKTQETEALPVTGDQASMLESKQCDASSLERVFFKDLHMTKSIKGTDIQASVVEFYSPGKFFILAQSPELLVALQRISRELQKTYSCSSVTTYVPHVGEVCGVKFCFDMNWYRGLVQTLAADQKTAKILYIDFGNEENVPVDRIKPLAANVPPFCPCAMECRIAGVVPVTDSWSAECCLSVKRLLAGNTVTVKLEETLENGRIHAVDILLSMGKKLSAFLLEHGYAAEETVSETPTRLEINAMVSASLENFRRCSDGKDDNTWAQPPEPLTQAVGDSFSVVVTHLQSPDDIIIQKVENAGVIQDLQLKLREHGSQTPTPQNFRPAPGTVCCAQFSEDKPVATRGAKILVRNHRASVLLLPPSACEPLVWSCAELPSDGQTVALLASVLENPLEFYCRINNPTDHQRLIELGAELKKHCEAQASPFEPKVGEPCCAMFPGDGEWYRALVNELAKEVSVNFVDYGYTMKVEKNHIRSITPGLLTLPFQAIRCWLTGVQPLGSEWSSEALLWFQNLVDGEQLSARILSLTEQGYGVELESRGHNVAAALISEQLAIGPEGIPKETTSDSGQQEKTQEHKETQIIVQASTPTGAKEIPTEGPTAMPSEVPSFPVDWKTVELPLNDTFQPCFAAVTSPSLFYLLAPNQVDHQKLQEVMTELAVYCSNIQASLSSTVLSRPTSGAACCAQFSADNNWYRAMALDVGEKEMSVVYADYGNTEKVPFSRVLPIPARLLQLPFQITRCTLTGKEHFPAVFPEALQQMFHSLLLSGVLATAQSFDGSVNVLSLSQPPETGGGDFTAMLLKALQAQAKSPPSPTLKADHTDRSTSPANSTAAPECPLLTPKPEAQKATENTPATPSLTMTPKASPQTPQQNKNTPAVSVNEDPVQNIIAQMEAPCKTSKTDDSQIPGCCCLNLTTKIDHLEHLVQEQLSLIRQLVGKTK
ncbi:tudor domain-containing protein 1 [Notothenia coriiceps]|uniref:Tudor domain-containing protein 1 n=1 Tax=Notothenia coriiceps TaxID=8208 RepID=A0A6I9PRR4_9TELE|nr:PREDICTED: tudor domain-containing protein 1 [Notothenia coriiceps]